MERLNIDIREVKFATGEADAGMFSGYGAIFGNIDSHDDVIQRGAFKETLREWDENGKLPPMLLQHGGGFFGGTADDLLPVGQWNSMEENSKGLKVEGTLFALGTDRGQYLQEGLKTGVLDGLSIGYNVRSHEPGTKPGDPRRKITNVELVELSIVTFPSNPKARIGRVKAITVEQTRELEGTLRDEGLSCKDRLKAVSVFKAWLLRDAEEPVSTPRDEDVSAELARTLKRFAEILTA